MSQSAINFQTILSAEDLPAFAGVPDAVVKLAFDDGMAPAKAWRTHLLLTQAQVAARMGVTQSAYAQLESSAKLRKASREKIAAALGINAQQLDF